MGASRWAAPQLRPFSLLRAPLGQRFLQVLPGSAVGGLPPPDFDKREFMAASAQELELVQTELDSLLQKQAVELADSPKGHISRWFLVSKRGTNAMRPVLNMKPGNRFVRQAGRFEDSKGS